MEELPMTDVFNRLVVQWLHHKASELSLTRFGGQVVINPAVDRVTFLETGHRKRLTLVGIGAGVNL